MGSRINRAPDSSTEPVSAGQELRSGRAVSDERGNSTWEWQTQPGVFSRDIDTQQLRVLVGEQLQIEEWQPPVGGLRRR